MAVTAWIPDGNKTWVEANHCRDDLLWLQRLMVYVSALTPCGQSLPSNSSFSCSSRLLPRRIPEMKSEAFQKQILAHRYALSPSILAKGYGMIGVQKNKGKACHQLWRSCKNKCHRWVRLLKRNTQCANPSCFDGFDRNPLNKFPLNSKQLHLHLHLWTNWTPQ